MTHQQKLAARVALSALWIFTGITSAFLSPEIGYEVLAKGGVTGGHAALLIYLGSGLDIAIGIWLIIGKSLRCCYLIQLALIVCYTFLLTYFDYTYWLHPFGPLTKNIPIIILIYFLYSEEKNGKKKMP